jgi:hypothetical protein
LDRPTDTQPRTKDDDDDEDDWEVKLGDGRGPSPVRRSFTEKITNIGMSLLTLTLTLATSS